MQRRRGSSSKHASLASQQRLVAFISAISARVRSGVRSPAVPSSHPHNTVPHQCCPPERRLHYDTASNAAALVSSDKMYIRTVIARGAVATNSRGHSHGSIPQDVRSAPLILQPYTHASAHPHTHLLRSRNLITYRTRNEPAPPSRRCLSSSMAADQVRPISSSDTVGCHIPRSEGPNGARATRDPLSAC